MEHKFQEAFIKCLLVTRKYEENKEEKSETISLPAFKERLEGKILVNKKL